ncbi:hypothetical protein GCM10020218_064370 [Dactylosporangium vinaceum]
MFTLRRMAAILAVVVAVVALGAPPAMAVSQFQKLYQEPDAYEARFPDILKLDDGRLMAVWHRATEHVSPTSFGTVQVSFGTRSGATWSWVTHQALAHPATMADRDMRDPKIGKMHDGSVVLTFFVPGDGVYYSVWKPGWNNFTDPVKLVVPGIGGSALAEHGSVLALDDRGGRADQVLIPVYNDTGAWFVRATWQPVSTVRLLVADAFQLGANTPVGNGFTENYTEPSFVQVQGTVVAVVRHAQNMGTTSNQAPALVLRWDPYTFTGAAGDYTTQFVNVLASSHNLLKTHDDKVLFTFGDKAVALRPTYGILVDQPLQTWPAGPKVLIYNSGIANGDQANPSSVEVGSGTAADPFAFFTLAYNAKAKSTTEGNNQSPNGGSLWIMRSVASEY